MEAWHVCVLQWKKMAMSQRASIVTTSSLTSSELDSEYEFRDDCKQILCSSSLSTERGKVQKTCQLIWFPLLPAVALLIYSTVYIVQDVQDYIAKVGLLHDSNDILSLIHI